MQVARSIVLVGVALILVLSLPVMVRPSSATASPPASVSVNLLNVPLSPGANFPTYMGSGERTDNGSSGAGMINVTNVPTLHPLWNYTTDGQVASQAIIANGLVYFDSWDGYEYAVYASNGTLAWQTYTGVLNDTTCGGPGGPTSTATFSGGEIYVNGGIPSLYVLNASTGAVRWDVHLGGSNPQVYLWSSPLLYKGNIYDGIASDCGNGATKPLVPAGLVEISNKTHAILHYFNSSVPNLNGSSIWGSPSVNPTTNTVYVATGDAWGTQNQTSEYDEAVIALNASTLAVKAKYQVPLAQQVKDGDFGSTPILFTPPGGPAMAVAIDKNGYLYDFYQSNLTLRWRDMISNHTTVGSAAYGGGHIYVLGPSTSIDSVTYNASVRSINPLNGKILWQVGLPNTDFGYGAPLAFNNTLFVRDGNTVYAFESATGKLLTTLQAGSGTIFPPLSTSRSELYVESGDELVAYDLSLVASASDSATGAAGTYAFVVHPSGGLPAYTYNWSFGDGQYSSLKDPTHTYSESGDYTVNVTVTDLAGTTAKASLIVDVDLGESPVLVRPYISAAPGPAAIVTPVRSSRRL